MKNAGKWAPEGWSPMLISLGALAIAFAVRYALHQYLGEHYRFLFFSAAAVLVCAYAGIWRALFVAIAGLLLGFYFFVQPYESFSEPDAEDFGAIVVYLLTTLVMLFLVEWLQRSKYEAHILMLETNYRNKRLEEVLANLSEARNSASTNAERVDMLAATVPHIWSTRRSGGKIEYFNAKLYEITGMPHGSLDGEGWTNAMHPHDAESVDEISRRVERTGVGEEIRVRMRMADGAYHSFDAECSRLEDRHGKVIVWSSPTADETRAGTPVTNRLGGAK
jgi:PAS domain S-box-containing protein